MCVPVLSPFPPDPSTPLRTWSILSATEIETAYAAACALTQDSGVPLGPPCGLCALNTVPMPAASGQGAALKGYGEPRLFPSGVIGGIGRGTTK